MGKSIKTDLRADALARRNEARRAFDEIATAVGTARQLDRWGGDPLAVARARRQKDDLELRFVETHAAVAEAEREYLRVCAEEGAAKAPEYREHHQAQARAICDALEDLVRLGDATEASGADARHECATAGTWHGEQAYDAEIVALVAQVRLQLPAWKSRMARAGWL